MERREVGRTGIELSVVGLGTAQLQVLAERQALATLRRGFERGVNWVHSAPDYGEVEPWIAAAIREADTDVKVLAQGPGPLALLEPYFENTVRRFGRDRIDLYGLGCIDDLERVGENVWGRRGMVEYLVRQRAAGRLGALFCTTHGTSAYVETLIASGVFDAIMLAWNPLGFHLLTYDAEREGRAFENIAEHRTRVFPVAARSGVSLLLMKVLGGGILARGRGLPPHHWPPDASAPAARDLIRLALDEPGVCAAAIGVASPSEVDEICDAGGAAPLGAGRRAAVLRDVEAMRLSLCSRCGECEPTCSRGLAISGMFRDAYIWNYRTETFMADDRFNYFHLHPDATLACSTCTDRSCACPQGLSVPEELSRIHAQVHRLAAAGLHPGPIDALPVIPGPHPVRILSREVPDTFSSGRAAVVRLLVENVGTEMWASLAHTGDPALSTGIGVSLSGRLHAVEPLRGNISPGQRSQIAIEVIFGEAATAELALHLMPLDARAADERATRLHAGMVRVAPPVPAYGARVVSHVLPAEPAAGATYGCQVTLENTGTHVWLRDPNDGHPVEVVVFIDGETYAVLKLPLGSVAEGEQTTLHFAMRAPLAPGRHEVRVEAVHQHVTWFRDQGVEPLLITLDVGAAVPSAGDRAFAQSLRHNLWHYQPTQGIARSRDGRPFPLFIERARGCRLWDPDGHEFLDYTMSWGATILGHADDRVQAAIRAVLDEGALPPFPHPVEMEVSAMICEDLPGAEMVVFGKNGSDVCTVAARMARLVTGRRVILSCGFHGWQDFGLDYFSFQDSGIPEASSRVLYKFEFNDLEGFHALYREHRDDLAAVMIEPCGPAGAPHVGIHGEADPGFLEAVAEAARAAGALLIFDEIITGYRHPHGSVQRARGITADLTCLGKALASGMPLSALAGASRIFYDAFFRTHYCPTFKGEIYSFAAAKAAIDIYRSNPVAGRIRDVGTTLMTAIDDICRQVGLDAGCTGPPFRFGLRFNDEDHHVLRLKRTLYMQELLKEGIVTVTGIMLPSAAHDNAVVARTIASIGTALEVVAGAARRGELDRRLEIPLL